MPFEVEQKYPIDDSDIVVRSLQRGGWRQTTVQTHRDAYFNHPCKDFVRTGEALRIRRIDGIGHVTYKGPKLPGEIKARLELEWPTGAGDADGTHWERLLAILDFRPVAVVHKQRRQFSHDQEPDLTVVIDRVDELGTFAEIETVIDDAERPERDSAVATARQRIRSLAGTLGLTRTEPRSYLTQLLALRSVNEAVDESDDPKDESTR